MKSIILLALVAVAAAGHHGTVNSMQQVKVKELYDSIVTKDYYPNLRPYGVNGTDATFVTVQLRDVKILNVDETKGLFTFQTYARKSWIDPRLAYNDTTVSYIPIRDCKSLWAPDIFFLDGVESSTFPLSAHQVPRTGRIFPSGRVFYSFRLTQTIHCPAIYTTGVKEITCPVRLGSYGFFTDEVQLAFKEGADYTGVNVVKDVVIPKFTFGGVTTQQTCTTAATTRSADHDHVHSCVQADFKFIRA